MFEQPRLLLPLVVLGPRARVAQLLLACAVSCSCQAEDEHAFAHYVAIGDEVEVFSDRRLCGDDILLIEQTVARVEGVLGTTVGDPIPMFVYDQGLRHCSPGASGCLVNGELHTLWQSIEHELVHAIANPLGQVEPFWMEGMAEALSDRTRRGETGAAEALTQDRDDLDYATAGHFVRWLLEERGEQGLQLIARGGDFGSAYGLELDDAVMEYERDAPWSYPRWDPCRGEALAPTAMDHWQVTIAAECAAEGSTADGSIGTGARRSIDVQQAGTYRLRLDGGRAVKMIYCQMDVLESPPMGELAGDIMREDAGLRPPSTFHSGEDYEVQLEAGMHQLWFSTEDGDGERLELELVRR